MKGQTNSAVAPFKLMLAILLHAVEEVYSKTFPNTADVAAVTVIDRSVWISIIESTYRTKVFRKLRMTRTTVLAHGLHRVCKSKTGPPNSALELTKRAAITTVGNHRISEQIKVLVSDKTHHIACTKLPQFGTGSWCGLTQRRDTICM